MAEQRLGSRGPLLLTWQVFLWTRDVRLIQPHCRLDGWCRLSPQARSGPQTTFPPFWPSSSSTASLPCLLPSHLLPYLIRWLLQPVYHPHHESISHWNRHSMWQSPTGLWCPSWMAPHVVPVPCTLDLGCMYNSHWLWYAGAQGRGEGSVGPIWPVDQLYIVNAHSAPSGSNQTQGRVGGQIRVLHGLHVAYGLYVLTLLL